MKNNKGFTLMELLVTITIIALISGIAIISFNVINDKAKENYYKTIEKSLLLSGNDYFENNRSKLPISGSSKVAISELIDGKYIEPIKDRKGNICTGGNVYVYHNSNANNYNYEVCLKCNDDYETDSEYCNNIKNNADRISISATKKTSGNKYPLLSYLNAEVSNEDIKVIISFLSADYFVVTDYLNTSGQSCSNTIDRCDINNGVCEMEFTSTKRLKVLACNNSLNEVASREDLNIKIDKTNNNLGPDFNINSEKKYLIQDGETKDISIGISNIKSDLAVKSINYCINESDCNTLDKDKYIINNSLPSGSYTLSVTLTDINDVSNTKSVTFDVSYLVSLKYSDDNIQDFEVIKNKKYGYLDNLPEAYDNKAIKWIYRPRENETYEVSNDTNVSLGSRHTLIMEYRNLVEDLNNSYCDNKVYNGENQLITKEAPEGVIFTNNVQKNSNTYTIHATLIDGYSWKNENPIDNFVCEIYPEIGASLSATNTLKSTTQTVTLSCGNNDDIKYWYFGNKNNPTESEYDAIANWTNTKSVSEAGTYYLTCIDEVGNTGVSEPLYIDSYTINNMLVTTAGTIGMYTTSNYEQVSTNTYIAPRGTIISPANVYIIPIGSNSNRYEGVSVGTASTTPATLETNSLTLNGNTTYSIWFKRNTVYFRYLLRDGEMITPTTTTLDGDIYNWTKNNSNNLIMRSEKNKGIDTAIVLSTGYRYGVETIDLADYNNENYIKITNENNRLAVRGQEWICESGCKEAEQKFNQGSMTFDANSVCESNLATEDCMIIIGVNWISSDSTITINAGFGIDSVELNEWTGTGTSIMTKTLPIGSTIDLSTITKSYKNGYSGIEYIKENEAGSIDGNVFIVGENDTTITLNATTFTTTFHKNGATSQDGNTGETITKSCTLSGSETCSITSPTIVSANTPTIIGYSTSQNDHVSSWNNNTAKTVPVNGVTDYYAQTSSNQVTHTINFDVNGNGGSNSSESCTTELTYNGVEASNQCDITIPSITAPANTPSILGWTNASDNHNHGLTPGETLPISSDGTYYAQTTKLEVTYNQIFDKNDADIIDGGTVNVTKSCTIAATYNGVAQEESCDITTPIIGSGTYTLLLWSRSSTEQTTTVDPDTSFTLTSANTEMTWYALCQYACNTSKMIVDASEIIDPTSNTVFNGNGLWSDPWDSTKYIYRGSDPYNYITFNGATWRIMSIDNNTGYMKIVLDNPTQKTLWNSNISSGTYYYSAVGSSGRASTIKQAADAIYDGYSSDIKSYVQSATYYDGYVTEGTNSADKTLSNSITTEKQHNYTGTIGVPSVSEYIKACSSVTTTTLWPKLAGGNERNLLVTYNNWMYNPDTTTWLINSVGGNNINTIRSDNGGISKLANNGAQRLIRPVLYLKADLTYLGNGTKDNPFKIQMEKCSTNYDNDFNPIIEEDDDEVTNLDDNGCGWERTGSNTQASSCTPKSKPTNPTSGSTYTTCSINNNYIRVSASCNGGSSTSAIIQSNYYSGWCTGNSHNCLSLGLSYTCTKSNLYYQHTYTYKCLG